MTRHDQPNESGEVQPLLRPARIADLRLPNRVVMAPMTRCRATNDDLAPTDLHAAYYAQRATAGLIVTEGTWVSERSIGRPHVPGIYTERQVRAWRRVTDAVHALGGRIVQQLWYAGARETVAPREMTAADIDRMVADYGAAAERARRAGFDGAEIAANGVYPIAQFLNPRLNRRADGHGVRRDRLLMEIVDAVAAAWDVRRVGVRLSPYWTARDEPADRGRSGHGDYPYTADEPALAGYDHVVAELSERSVGYLHLRGRAPSAPGAAPDADEFARYRKLFDGPLIANHGFDRRTGNAIVDAGIADAVSYAEPFIANPDLVSRFALGHDLAAGDRRTHYAGGAHGYVDYPVWPSSRR